MLRISPCKVLLLLVASITVGACAGSGEALTPTQGSGPYPLRSHMMISVTNHDINERDMAMFVTGESFDSFQPIPSGATVSRGSTSLHTWEGPDDVRTFNVSVGREGVVFDTVQVTVSGAQRVDHHWIFAEWTEQGQLKAEVRRIPTQD